MSTTDTIIINKILNTVAERQATDVHFMVGNYPFLRIKGELLPLTAEELITPEAMQSLISFFVPEEKRPLLEEKGELRYLYDWLGKARFRAHFFKQKGYFSLSLKLINRKVFNLDDLGLPKTLANFIQTSKGLLFITGPFHSGRSTTLAAIIQTINQTRAERILYLEEPIENLFVNEKSVIEQREVGTDVASFAKGLESAKDEDINIVAVAKVDGVQSLELLLELAESGRLVIAILDYYSASAALDGVVSDFNDAKAPWARNVLADFLVGVIGQRLLATIDGGLALAVEVLTASPSAKALIKEGRFAQLDSIIQTSKAEGMVSLERSLMDLVNRGLVKPEEALKHALDPKSLKVLLKR